MSEVCFGVDVGGTTVKLGLVDSEGNLLEKREFASPKDPNAMFDVIVSHMDQVIVHYPGIRCMGAGVGVPGPVIDEAMVRSCSNLGWGRVMVAEELTKRAHMNIKVANDANMAAMGEMWMGAGRGCRNLVMLTVGTGVGGGIIVDGKILAGALGGGGEIGHIPLHYHPDWQCNCGKYGCLEVTASASGIIRAAKQYHPFSEMQDLNAKDVFEAMYAGDVHAREAVENAGKALGEACAILACVLNPEMFLIGGGVSAAGKALLDPIEQSFREKCFPPCANVQFARASLGNNAGIYGGAALFFAH